MSSMPGPVGVLLLMAGTAAGWGPAVAPAWRSASRAASPALNAAPDEGDGAFAMKIANFLPRQELPRVRNQLVKLQEDLGNAVSKEDYVQAAMLRDDVAELRSKDPAVMAASLREEMARRTACEEYAEAARCRDELMILRRFLPQFQLAGLWKGARPAPARMRDGPSAMAATAPAHPSLARRSRRQLPQPRRRARPAALRRRHALRHQGDGRRARARRRGDLPRRPRDAL